MGKLPKSPAIARLKSKSVYVVFYFFQPLRYLFFHRPPISTTTSKCFSTPTSLATMRCSLTPSPCRSARRPQIAWHLIYALFYSKTVDDIVYEVDCQLVVIKDGDVDIGAFLIIDCIRLQSLMCLLCHRCQPIGWGARGDFGGGCRPSQQCCPLFPSPTNQLRQEILPYISQGSYYFRTQKFENAHWSRWSIGLHEGCQG